MSELLFNVTNVSKHLQSEKCLIFLTNTNDDRCTLMNTNGLDSNNNINDETTIRKSITNSRSSSTTNATSKSMNTNHLSEMMNGNYTVVATVAGIDVQEHSRRQKGGGGAATTTTTFRVFRWAEKTYIPLRIQQVRSKLKN